MSLLHRAISALQRSFQTQQEIEDAFLAGAVDIYDLERRMRALDKRDAQEPFHLRHSF